MIKILNGHCIDILRTLPAESVHTVVTSPPYWGLRDYNLPPQIWGGVPDCEHEWGAEVPARQQTGGTGSSTLGPASGGHGISAEGIERSQQRQAHQAPPSAFCIRCDAWRGQLGLEPTPQLFVEHLVEVFREVRRVLRTDGTLWLNLGDSYATGAGKVGDHPGGGDQGSAWAGRPAPGATSKAGRGRALRDGSHAGKHTSMAAMGPMTQPNRMPLPGLKPKDLVMIPARVALALQADGWWLRQDIIWHKPNPMPESVTDRCTKSHEYIFLLSKSERYYFDSEAISEPVTGSTIERMSQPSLDEQHGSERVPGKTNGPMKAVLKSSGNKERKPASARGVPVDTGGKSAGAVAGSVPWEGSTRNKRSVWTVTTQPFKEAHFATFPPALIEPCILASTSEHGHCPKCGAGWERQVDVGPVEDHPQRANRTDDAKQFNAEENEYGESGSLGRARARSTTGWAAGCDCGLAPVPGVVLDPFGGAGTIGLVADRHHRDAVLIELNPEYIGIAERRIVGDAPLFAEVSTS